MHPLVQVLTPFLEIPGLGASYPCPSAASQHVIDKWFFTVKHCATSSGVGGDSIPYSSPKFCTYTRGPSCLTEYGDTKWIASNIHAGSTNATTTTSLLCHTCTCRSSCLYAHACASTSSYCSAFCSHASDYTNGCRTSRRRSADQEKVEKKFRRCAESAHHRCSNVRYAGTTASATADPAPSRATLSACDSATVAITTSPSYFISKSCDYRDTTTVSSSAAAASYSARSTCPAHSNAAGRTSCRCRSGTTPARDI